MALSNLTTLSFSLYSNPGTYALLLGSGVSRTANIPTGWDIVCDLIRKIAAIDNTKISGKEDEWFKSQYGKEPSYSELLDKLTSSSTERVGLMSRYFEPNEHDKELGYKQPTKAHKAIAQLIKDGYINVVITTNFDRLLERALEAIGLTPQTVYKEEDWNTITPFVHSKRPTIIKVNGDYIDCTFRNTEGELDHYPDNTKEQLKWIFENYGLITCGWSGDWDTGLVEIIESSKKPRYNTYLSYINNVSYKQKELADKRGADTLQIKDADTLFTEISEQVNAIARMDIPNDLDDKIVVARIKKYLSKDEYRIQFSDLLKYLTDNAVTKVMAHAHYDFYVTKETFDEYVSIHMDAVRPLLLVTPDICHWGNKKQIAELGEAIVRLCLKPWKNGESRISGTEYLHAIAPTLLLYVVGICCVKYERFKELNSILSLTIPPYNFLGFRRCKLLNAIGETHWDTDRWEMVLGNDYRYPKSIFLRRELQSYLITLFQNEGDFENYFDIWEQLKSLVFAYNKCYFTGHFYAPNGMFIYNQYEYKRDPMESEPYTRFFKSADELKNGWGPIKQGMFGGSYEEYKSVKEQTDKYLLHYGIG